MQTTFNEEGLAAAAAYWSTQPPQPENPGPAWTDADEAAFADAPLYLSGPARYSVVPCRACETGGELPCEECGAVGPEEVGR